MSQTHKAIATTAKGVIDEISAPTVKPGPGEVLVRVAYAATIPLDAYQVDRGLYIPSYPQTLGFSATGKVFEVGQGVTDLKVGEKVVALGFGASQNRGLQEYLVCPRFLISKLPVEYPLDKAAAIPDNFVTAYWILFGPHLGLDRPSSFPSPSIPADADEPILVYGASSSAGQYLVQLLRLAGYSNIIATGSPNNHALLQKLGVRHVINYRSADVVKDILDKAEKKPRLAIDVISASPTLNVIAQVLAPDGKVAILLPVKEGDTITNSSDSEMVTTIPERVKEKFPTQEIIPVSSLTFVSDEWVRTNLMPNVLPPLLEKDLLQPNPIRLQNEGTFKERVEAALDLLRNNKVSGEKVIVEVTNGKDF